MPIKTLLIGGFLRPLFVAGPSSVNCYHRGLTCEVTIKYTLKDGAARVLAGNVAAIVPLQWRTVSNRCRAEHMNSIIDLFIAFGNVFAIVDRRRLQLYRQYLNDTTIIKQSLKQPQHFYHVAMIIHFGSFTFRLIRYLRIRSSYFH